MSWENVFDENIMREVLLTPVVGTRVTMLSTSDGDITIDTMAIMNAMQNAKSKNQFMEMISQAGGKSNYELRIHDHPQPYVSVYEQKTNKMIGIYHWDEDNEPLTAGDPRMQMLSCQLEENFNRKESM